MLWWPASAACGQQLPEQAWRACKRSAAAPVKLRWTSCLMPSRLRLSSAPCQPSRTAQWCQQEQGSGPAPVELSSTRSSVGSRPSLLQASACVSWLPATRTEAGQPWAAVHRTYVGASSRGTHKRCMAPTGPCSFAGALRPGCQASRWPPNGQQDGAGRRSLAALRRQVLL